MEKGHYSDTIVLKTDSEIRPDQNTPVFGMIFGSEEKEIHEMFKQLVDQPKRMHQGVPGR